jgi:bacillithiol system protein YtxJ
MNWIELSDESQLENIKKESFEKPVVIFKHSTRCSISAMAKNRLEREKPVEGVTFYYLDLIRYRNISNRIAEIFDVVHESPQVLLIRNGVCVYDESHNGIAMDEIADATLQTA